MSHAARKIFWARTKRLTLWLLALWGGVNLALPWFARDLNSLRPFGFELGWWLAAEGAMLVYLAIIVVYVVAMDRLDAAYLAAEAAAPAAAVASGPPPAGGAA